VAERNQVRIDRCRSIAGDPLQYDRATAPSQAKSRVDSLRPARGLEDEVELTGDNLDRIPVESMVNFATAQLPSQVESILAYVDQRQASGRGKPEHLHGKEAERSGADHRRP